ncbi:MAG: hypothetical protein M9883_18505 [Methylobacteriaceae bacterium]|nr:hypothetical protein [Methylobacteriaceae bacterium]
MKLGLPAAALAATLMTFGVASAQTTIIKKRRGMDGSHVTVIKKKLHRPHARVIIRERHRHHGGKIVIREGRRHHDGKVVIRRHDD